MQTLIQANIKRLSGFTKLYRPVTTIMLVALLSGCAFLAGKENPEKLRFVKASQGKANGFYAFVAGDVSYCMLEWLDENIIVDSVVYEDGSCRIEWHRD